MAKSIGVFLVHSQEMAREGLNRALEEYEGIEVVGQSTSVESALAHVAYLAPAVIIMESMIPESSGTEVVPEFTISISRDQEGKSLVNVTGFRERGHLGEVAIMGRFSERRVQVMDVGPEGYRFRDGNQEELVNAVVSAAHGELASGKAEELTSPDFNSALDQLRDAVRDSGKPALQSADGVEIRPRSNGHTNGAGNGRAPVVSNGHTNGAGDGRAPVVSNSHANEHENGSSNGTMITQNGQAERVTEGWFGPVTIREAASLEKDTAEYDDTSAPAGDVTQHLPEGTEIMDNPAIHWDEQAESDESDGAWMNIWQAPRRREGGEKESPTEVELLFPTDVGAPSLYRFILRLKRATKGEIKESHGSIEGTSVRMLVHRAAPLIEILRSMPEVMDVKAEVTGQYGPGNGWGPYVSAEHLPQRLHIELKTNKEEGSKQLQMALNF